MMMIILKTNLYNVRKYSMTYFSVNIKNNTNTHSLPHVPHGNVA